MLQLIVLIIVAPPFSCNALLLSCILLFSGVYYWNPWSLEWQDRLLLLSNHANAANQDARKLGATIDRKHNSADITTTETSLAICFNWNHVDFMSQSIVVSHVKLSAPANACVPCNDILAYGIRQTSCSRYPSSKDAIKCCTLML